MDDVTSTVRYAQQSARTGPRRRPDRQIQGGLVARNSHSASGDLEAACQSYTEFQAGLRQSGDIATATGITFVLASIAWPKAICARRSMPTSKRCRWHPSGGPLPMGTADLYRGLSELCCEHGDFRAAAESPADCQKAWVSKLPSPIGSTACTRCSPNPGSARQPG